MSGEPTTTAIMTQPATNYNKHRTGARARGKLQQIIISNRRGYSGYSGGGPLCACELRQRRQLRKRLRSKRKPRTDARPCTRARYRLSSNRVSEGVYVCDVRTCVRARVYRVSVC